MVLIELKANDRVLKTRAGLRDRIYVAYDRFGRLLLISGSLPPLCKLINQLVNSPLDRVWHQSLYALANGKIKSGMVPEELSVEEIDDLSIFSKTHLGEIKHLAPVLDLSETPPFWELPTPKLGVNRSEWTTT